MTIIDLRPYANKPQNSNLVFHLINHHKEIRGITKVIYEVPDEIWVTKEQAKQFDATVTFIDGNIEIPIVVKDELTS